MKVAIIGAGSLGQSIGKGLLTNKVVSSLYLTKRNTNSIKDFENYDEVILSSDNTEAVVNSDILIFAVQPRHLNNILKNILPHLHKNHVLISVITGFSIAKIEAIVGERAKYRSCNAKYCCFGCRIYDLPFIKYKRKRNNRTRKDYF
jgi:pyrroline-5-carboxylate reductase